MTHKLKMFSTRQGKVENVHIVDIDWIDDETLGKLIRQAIHADITQDMLTILYERSKDD